MSGLKVRLFGKFVVEHDQEQVIGLDSHKVQELFSYLLIHYDHPQSRESLSEVLWGNQPPLKSKKNLRQTLWRLQSALDRLSQGGCPVLLANEDWVQVNANVRNWVDGVELEKAYNQFNNIWARELSVEDYELLEKSVVLYRGELLEGWYEDWCVFERERFQFIHTSLLDKLIQYCEINHRYDEGIAYCTEILRRDQAYERAHRQIMRLYTMSGNRTQALRQYARCVSALREDLNVEPSERTQQLYEQIRADRFVPPSFNGTKAQLPEGRKEVSYADILTRLHNFSIELDQIQFQIQNDISYLENSIQTNR
jgi:DNA-binding SARP family transcriptional activator